MDVYLKNEKLSSTFHFPVNPFGITVNRNKKYDTADIVDFGEVDLSDKGKKIKELSLSTLLPKEYDTYCRYVNIPSPIDAIQKLEKWMEQEDSLRLIITSFNFNGLVNISSISEDEKAGEAGDKYITLNFRTWRELKIEKVTTSQTVVTQLQSSRTTPAQPPTPKPTHNVGEWIVVTASVLNVRSGPGETNSILGTIKKDQCYKIGGVQGNWADIYWGNHGGWICTDYVK